MAPELTEFVIGSLGLTWPVLIALGVMLAAPPLLYRFTGQRRSDAIAIAAWAICVLLYFLRVRGGVEDHVAVAFLGGAPILTAYGFRLALGRTRLPRPIQLGAIQALALEVAWFVGVFIQIASW